MKRGAGKRAAALVPPSTLKKLEREALQVAFARIAQHCGISQEQYANKFLDRKGIDNLFKISYSPFCASVSRSRAH